MVTEIKGNLWREFADWKCITTNGFVKNNGRAVMGRGVARQARDRYPDIDYLLGQQIMSLGNIVHFLGARDGACLLSFPVKRHWREEADLALIRESLLELKDMAYAVMNRMAHPPRILLPKPGCGNGGRDWESEVKPVVEPILTGWPGIAIIDR